MNVPLVYTHLKKNKKKVNLKYEMGLTETTRCEKKRSELRRMIERKIFLWMRCAKYYPVSLPPPKKIILENFEKDRE